MGHTNNNDNDNDAVVNKLSTDITNYLKNKSIPYITVNGMKMDSPPASSLSTPTRSNTNSFSFDSSYRHVDGDGDAAGLIKMETVHINTPVKCIADLLRICETYELAENVKYNIDMKALHKIYPHLCALNRMIGMTTIKQTIVDQIMYFIQNLHLTNVSSPEKSKPLPPVHVVTTLNAPAPSMNSNMNSHMNPGMKKKNTTPSTTTTPTENTTIKPFFTFGGESGLFSIFIPEVDYHDLNGKGTEKTEKDKEQEKEREKEKKDKESKEKEKEKETKKLNNAANVFKFPLFKPSSMDLFSCGMRGVPPFTTASASAASAAAAASAVSGSSGDYMHTVLYGPPGTGKTEIAKILGNIFCNLGVLKSNTFKKVTRSDLVAGYLGQTAIKTREVIESAIGGVLFIDEAYALGNTEKRDSFSKECIDTLCEALSDHKHELMVIIAGYEKELNDCFFSYNEGLSSRFTWRYKIENYDAVELRKIFEKIIKDNHWTFDETDAVKDEWFKSRCNYFKYFGRDIEVFFTKTKIAHGRRVFYLTESDRRKLIMKDLDAGFELFTATEDVKSRGQTLSGPAVTMYL